MQLNWTVNFWKLEHLAYANVRKLGCKAFCAVWPASPSTCGLWITVGVINWELGSCCSPPPQGQWSSHRGRQLGSKFSEETLLHVLWGLNWQKAKLFRHWHAFPWFSYLSEFRGNLRVSGSLKIAYRSLVCESDLMPRMLRFLTFLPSFLNPSTSNPTPGWKLETNTQITQKSRAQAQCEVYLILQNILWYSSLFHRQEYWGSETLQFLSERIEEFAWLRDGLFHIPGKQAAQQGCQPTAKLHLASFLHFLILKPSTSWDLEESSHSSSKQF